MMTYVKYIAAQTRVLGVAEVPGGDDLVEVSQQHLRRRRRYPSMDPRRSALQQPRGVIELSLGQIHRARWRGGANGGVVNWEARVGNISVAVEAGFALSIRVLSLLTQSRSLPL